MPSPRSRWPRSWPRNWWVAALIAVLVFAFLIVPLVRFVFFYSP